MGRGKSARTLDLIEAAREILAEIQPASVRAVCYRLFTMNLIANMLKTETNKVSSALTWAREQNRIPWHWIVDDTRPFERVSAWDNPAEYVDVVKKSYRRDRWADQPVWLELWSEKSTVRGTVAPVLDAYGIGFRVMRGYGSATVVHQAAEDSIGRGKPVIVLYVGDWDPSGLHMSQVDLPGRIEEYGGQITMVRVALTKPDTMSGIHGFPSDSKQGDPRYRWYRERYGARCWELDALSPVILRERLEEAIQDHLDRDAWDRADAAERAELESLSTILDGWPGISGQASKYGDRA